MKEKAGKIDLHLHSFYSDGQESPKEIIRHAREDGQSLISITDHNKFTFTQPQNIDGVTIIPGIEFSTAYWGLAREDAVEDHIVGLFPYGVNPDDFADLLENIRAGKKAYVKAILEDLATRNIHITMEEVYARADEKGDIGRHPVAEVLVEKGYEPDVETAMDHQVGNYSPYYIPSCRYIAYPLMEDVVKRIRACGGIPCLAHPYGYKLTEEEIEQMICDFKQAAGEVAAMEVYYELYLQDEDRIAFLERMQEKYGLLPSSASDRHRTDQPFASRGDMKQFEEMVRVLNETGLSHI